MRRRRQQHRLREAQLATLAGLARQRHRPQPPRRAHHHRRRRPAQPTPMRQPRRRRGARRRRPIPSGHPTPPPPAPSPPQHASAPHRAHAHTRSARHHQATQARLPTAQPRPRALTVTIDPAVLKGSTQIIKRGCDIQLDPSSRRCISAMSSQRLNFRPTSRSMPTSSNPHERCSATDGSRVASMRAITAWKP